MQSGIVRTESCIVIFTANATDRKRTLLSSQTVRPFYSAPMSSLITHILGSYAVFCRCGIYHRMLHSQYVIDQSLRITGEVHA